MGRAEFNSPGMDLKKLYEKSGGTPVIEVYKITVPPTSRPVYFVGRVADLASHTRARELWHRSGGETSCRAGSLSASMARPRRLPCRDSIPP